MPIPGERVRSIPGLVPYLPRIVHVLSGGAAKGFCHLGMIEALEKEGIRPDFIVGTSVGALLGASYSHFENVGEGCVRDPVELPSGGQVSPEGLFDDDARMVGKVGGAQPPDDGREERGRDRMVVRRAPGAFQRLFYRRERLLVVVVAFHISEPGEKLLGRVLVIDPARSLD